MTPLVSRRMTTHLFVTTALLNSSLQGYFWGVEGGGQSRQSVGQHLRQFQVLFGGHCRQRLIMESGEGESEGGANRVQLAQYLFG